MRRAALFSRPAITAAAALIARPRQGVNRRGAIFRPRRPIIANRESALLTCRRGRAIEISAEAGLYERPNVCGRAAPRFRNSFAPPGAEADTSAGIPALRGDAPALFTALSVIRLIGFYYFRRVSGPGAVLLAAANERVYGGRRRF